MTAPNQRLEQAAWHTRQLATKTTVALTHLNQELHTHDGHKTTNTDPRTGTNTISDPTANQATARHNITALQQDLYDWITDLEQRINAGQHLINQILKTRAPKTEPTPTLCRDGAHGKTLSPQLTAQIVTCWELPHKSGLCVRHYTAWYRQRTKGASK